MSPLNRPTCTVHSCLRAVPRSGDFCLPHWLGLSPQQRASVQGEPQTEPIDPRAVAEACALEDLFEAPAWGEAA